VRDALRAYVVAHLGEADGVLVIDETGLLKTGTKSAGVQRQYCGTAGRIENCQSGVCLTYATRHGRTFVDRELYLPQAWVVDQERRTAAGMPPAVTCATKLVLARRMIERAQRAGVPFGWVTGDEVYGSDSQMRSWLEKREISDGLAVSAPYQVWFEGARRWVADIAGRLLPSAWQPVRAGAGTKGERLYDWALLPLGAVADQRQRWLWFRRSLRAPKSWPMTSSPPLSRRLSQRWYGWSGRAGRLQRVAKAPRGKAGWTIRRSGVGLAGLATSPWLCWPRRT
jgi:hypothetical protein